MNIAQLSGVMKAELMTPRKLGLFWKPSVLPKKLIRLYFNCEFDDLVHALRIYDVSQIIFNGKNAHQFYEIPIHYYQGYWFVKGLVANRSYLAEIGVKMQENEFFPFIRSNVVQIPSKVTANHDLSSLDVLPLGQNTACPPKWKDRVSTYSYYEGTANNE